jgi:methionyl aminopeptidase
MKYTRKKEHEIELMRQSALLVSKTLAEVGKRIAPGVDTLSLDTLAETFIRDNGATPAFKGYSPDSDLRPFPYTLCVSVNHEVVHGFPNKDVVLKEGDVVSVDCGVKLNGYYGDSAYTFTVGEVKPEVLALLRTTRESLDIGIAKAIDGNRLGDVSYAIQHYVETRGYSVVREMVGHGIGTELHEEPEVPNYGRRGNGPRLHEGLVMAIEPMINLGTASISRSSDGWIIYTADKKPSAHYEHTVVVRKGKAQVLTTFEFIENGTIPAAMALTPVTAAGNAAVNKEVAHV